MVSGMQSIYSAVTCIVFYIDVHLAQIHKLAETDRIWWEAFLCKKIHLFVTVACLMEWKASYERLSYLVHK